MGAVQAQDYTGAKWGVGMRCRGVFDLDVDVAFNEGRILRTHVLRPTWHFVVPSDIRWMLALTAPRVNAVSAYYFRKVGLDDAMFLRCNELIVHALTGGKQLTRDELREVLARGGIAIDDLLRVTYIMMRAELDGVICSGGKRGRQFTYALLDERVPHTKKLDREEALGLLTRRYFSSHGPASIKDFVWWSGLMVSDARRGIEMNRDILTSEIVDELEYWYSPSERDVAEKFSASLPSFLLSNYDEYTIGYTNHDVIYDPVFSSKLELLFPHSIVIDGRVVGAWKREFKKDGVVITTKLFTSLDGAQKRSLITAAEAYGKFLRTSVRLE
jgi:hypothetical protein